MAGIYIRHRLEIFIGFGLSVSNFWIVILQKQRRIKNRFKNLWWCFLGKIEDSF